MTMPGRKRGMPHPDQRRHTCGKCRRRWPGSNGYIEINGGTVFVNGASNSDDSGLDYEYGATVNGGNVILMGSAAMAEDFTGGTQAYLMERTSGSAGSTVEVTDASGAVIVSYVSPKAFQAVTASAPGCTSIIVR